MSDIRLVDADTIRDGRQGERGNIASMVREAKRLLTPGKAAIVTLPEGFKPQTLRNAVQRAFGTGGAKCLLQPDGTYAIVLREAR